MSQGHAGRGNANFGAVAHTVGLRVRVQGSGFRVWGVGFRV